MSTQIDYKTDNEAMLKPAIEEGGKKQISNRTSASSSLLIVGLVLFLVGLLACVLPQAILAPGGGDTEGAWAAGFIAIFGGIPLCILAVILLIVGAITSAKEHKK